MGNLTSAFTRDDIATLIESIDDWEMIGSHEFNMMKMVLNAPLPPEDHEAYEVMTQIKSYFWSKEREIKEHRMNRQEKAVFLKAKLMLVRRDMDVNSVFEMATEEDTAPPATTPNLGPAPVSFSQSCSSVNSSPPTGSFANVVESASKLALAEFFIRDLGVWDHYQKFLAEREK